MFDLNRSDFLAASAALVLLCGGVAAAAPPDQGFEWPVPIVPTQKEWDVNNLGVLGVRAIVLPDVQAKLLQQPYSAEEHRNVQTLIRDMSLPRDGTDVTRSKTNPKATRHPGFYVLHGAFGYPAKNGYSTLSFLNRIQVIEDIVARDDRAIVLFRMTGNIAGPMYGFKGVGQPINVRESLNYDFDDQGLSRGYQPWCAEDLAFYDQLGGILKFQNPASGTAATTAIPLIGAAQPAPSAAAEARSNLERVNYTAAERKNLETLYAVVSDPQGFERPNREHFCASYRNTEASPYPTLDKMYGKQGGFSVSSIKNLKREITDFIANGNRAWVHISTSGIHSGPLFGVAASGKPLSWNEETYVTFDDAGKICQTTRLPVEGELYLQLGGTFTFPYRDYWQCDGCPRSPGRARLDLPAQAKN